MKKISQPPQDSSSSNQMPLIFRLVGISFFFFFSVIVCSKSQNDIPATKAGFGETIITPQENVQMKGFARSQVSTGVHDDLHARSLVIESDDGTTAVMMTLSLCTLEREYVGRIRSLIHDRTGIPETGILISCNHTHAGPSVDKAGEQYQEFLVENAAQSAVEAWNSRVPARIGVGPAKTPEIGRNRRRLLYGGLHPDPETGIIKIEDPEGNLMGVAFNYGCHPSALDWRNTLFSEDWPYYAIRGIKKEAGEHIWAAYFQSAEGDINVGYSSELSAVGAYMPIRNYEYIEVKGNQMAATVLDALPHIQTSGSHDIQVAIDFFDYPLRESFPVTLEKAENDAAAARKKLAALENVKNLEGTRIFDKVRVEVFQTGQRLSTARQFYSRKPGTKPVSIEQQAIRIGDAVFVSLPGEVFSEIGLAIKEGSPLEKTFVIGVANGYGGYLPTEKEFVEGDYEVDGCRYSPKAEKVCIESSLDLIGRLVK